MVVVTLDEIANSLSNAFWMVGIGYSTRPEPGIEGREERDGAHGTPEGESMEGLLRKDRVYREPEQNHAIVIEEFGRGKRRMR